MQATWLIVFAVASLSDAVDRSLTKRQSSEENAKIGNDKFFLVANGSHLLEVNLELNSVRALQFTGSGVSSIHVNANTSQIFICNDRTNEIWRTGVGVGDPTTLIVQKTGKENENREKLKLEACAVDWAAQQLYWINGDGRKGKLVRSDFSGNTDTLIDEHGDYKKVRSMVVDQSITDQTVLYFAGDKTVGDVKIPQSGKVDRTKDFIGNDDNDNEKDSPISVALDDSTRKLYWIDGNDEYVNVYDLEEEESDAVAGAGTPVAIAVGQSTVAVIDSSSIRIADTRNTSSSFVRRSVSGLGTGLTAIAAYSKIELYATLSPSTSVPSTQTWPTNLSDGTSAPLPNQLATTLVPTKGSSLEPSDSPSTTQTAHVTTSGFSANQAAHTTTDGSSTTQPAHTTSRFHLVSDKASGTQPIPTNRSYSGTETKVDSNKSDSSGLSIYYYIGIGIAVSIVVAAIIIVVVVVRRKTRRKAGFHSSTVLANRVTVATGRSTRKYVGTPGGGTSVTYNGTSVTVTPLEENLRDVSNDPVYEEIPEIGNNDSISFRNHQIDRDSGAATQKNDETAAYYIDWAEINTMKQSDDLYLSPHPQ
ncbi:serine-rich adhesin for platelets-like isoform X3 [Oscarella lobularis]|uniref:serine-rich adhesin for platelets-like isoform X3 n=1 Tax=Oscarella lobularis TaxID=121494 RepID=UPI0033134A1B